MSCSRAPATAASPLTRFPRSAALSESSLEILAQAWQWPTTLSLLPYFLCSANACRALGIIRSLSWEGQGGHFAIVMSSSSWLIFHFRASFSSVLSILLRGLWQVGHLKKVSIASSKVRVTQVGVPQK